MHSTTSFHGTVSRRTPASVIALRTREPTYARFSSKRQRQPPEYSRSASTTALYVSKSSDDDVCQGRLVYYIVYNHNLDYFKIFFSCSSKLSIGVEVSSVYRASERDTGRPTDIAIRVRPYIRSVYHALVLRVKTYMVIKRRNSSFSCPKYLVEISQGLPERERKMVGKIGEFHISRIAIGLSAK